MNQRTTSIIPRRGCSPCQFNVINRAPSSARNFVNKDYSSENAKLAQPSIRRINYSRRIRKRVINRVVNLSSIKYVAGYYAVQSKSRTERERERETQLFVLVFVRDTGCSMTIVRDRWNRKRILVILNLVISWTRRPVLNYFRTTSFAKYS